jgi:Zn-dependent metalloprotease
MGTCFCSVIPPHMLQFMATKARDLRVRQAALATLGATEMMRGQRDILGRVMPLEATQEPGEYKIAYDAQGRQMLPGRLVWQEGAQQSNVTQAREAVEGAHYTYELLARAFGWHSLNGRNMRMVSTVRYGQRYNNAFWQGRQMVYGDGDGYIFNRFTAAIDVCGHELTHGLTQFTCALEYQGQSGALNEHFSDVIGCLVDQWKQGHDVSQASWLVGKGLFTNRVRGEALRSMKAPGTAYNDPNLGKDPQPAQMSRFYQGQSDNGGVHINSGIPNKAFHLAATAIGGKAWEGAGRVWFYAHTQGGVQPWCNFEQYAAITVRKAQELNPDGGKWPEAVADAWRQVGVIR